MFLIGISTSSTASGVTNVQAETRYQVCSDVKCLPPVKKNVITELQIAAGAPGAAFNVPAGYALVPMSPTAAPTMRDATITRPATSKPIESSNNEPLLPFLLTAFGFGLAALFTPCVFPMIPITVSFFLNQGGPGGNSTRGGWKQALVFCLGIIVLFTALGFLVTAIAGPFGVVQLGSSPWVNGFIALVFFCFRT
jgi:thiol:disulfide interchange protein DsbD